LATEEGAEKITPNGRKKKDRKKLTERQARKKEKSKQRPEQTMKLARCLNTGKREDLHDHKQET
jgi:hypothetical protein